MVPPVSVKLAPPAVAPSVPEQPAPEIAAAGVAVFTRPAGYVSVMATPVSAAPVFGLVMTMVSTDVPLVAMLAGVNVLVAVGASAVTVSEAEAAAAFEPLTVCSALIGRVFVAT